MKSLAPLVIVCCAAVPASADADLPARVARLERAVAALEARADDAGAASARARLDLVQAVLLDADTRAPLAAEALDLGYDDGFFLGGGDGDLRFRLDVSGFLQARWVYNAADPLEELDADAFDGDDAGFDLRRVRIGFGGSVFDESLEFDVTLSASRAGAVTASNAYLEKNFEGTDLFLRAGQFKAPFLREELVSAKRQMLVDRSLVNGRFSVGRTQGLLLGALHEDVGWEVAWTDGIDGQNVGALEEDADFALSARGEWRLAGPWRALRDFSAWPGEVPAAMVGAAVHYEEGESGTSTDEADRLLGTVDLSLEGDGATFFAAAIYGRDTTGAETFHRWGVVVQGGVFVVPDEWEVFVRYEHGDLDEGRFDALSVVTAGLNRYWYGHALKFSADAGYVLDDLGPGFASDARGYRPAEEGQIVVRTQMQLLF